MTSFLILFAILLFAFGVGLAVGAVIGRQSMQDVTTATDAGQIGAQYQQQDLICWRAKWTVEKRMGNWTGEDIDAGLAPAPYEAIQREGNLLTYGGMSNLWQCLIGNGTSTADQTLTYFSNARAAIGVGDSSTAAAATQTDLQAATNKLRKAMDSTYPQHTDATTSGAATITFRSTFGTSDANFAWQEWVIANSTTNATGRILNRKVESLGTKTSAASWTFTCTITLS